LTTDLYLGADAGGTGLKFVVTDSGGQVRLQSEVPTDPASPSRTLQRLADAVRAEIGSSNGLSAVGLACAGIVDLQTGFLGRSPNLPGWEGADLHGEVRKIFGTRPVALANDVNGALFGEFKAGAGRGDRHLIMIALGTGVGGGVVIDGKLVTGAHCGAGEIGHMVLDPEGPACTCGGRGCLEAWAGSVGLLRSARTAANQPSATEAFRDLVNEQGEVLTTRKLSSLAEEGDKTALSLFAEVGDRLGQAVGNLVNVLDPDRVIIGGGVALAGDLILEPCRRRVARQVLAEDAARVPIVPAALGPHAAAVGAAWLAVESRPGA
jgi:glucokinase